MRDPVRSDSSQQELIGIGEISDHSKMYLFKNGVIFIWI